MITLLRNIVSDLVDKKLWPIAALLVVALVAVPLAIAAGGDSADEVDVPIASAPAETPSAGVTLAQDEVAAKTPAKRPANDDELVNVTYEELFDDPTPVAQPKRTGTPIPLDRPPAKISDNRDKKKVKDGGFPDLSPNPYR